MKTIESNCCKSDDRRGPTGSSKFGWQPVLPNPTAIRMPSTLSETREAIENAVGIPLFSHHLREAVVFCLDRRLSASDNNDSIDLSHRLIHRQRFQYVFRLHLVIRSARLFNARETTRIGNVNKVRNNINIHIEDMPQPFFSTFSTSITTIIDLTHIKDCIPLQATFDFCQQTESTKTKLHLPCLPASASPSAWSHAHESSP